MQVVHCIFYICSIFYMRRAGPLLEPGCYIARSGKLGRARSRLYRAQILQENMRLKALAEIYTMHSFAQLCNLIFLVNILPKIVIFSKSSKISEKFPFFCAKSSFLKKQFQTKVIFIEVQRSALCRSRRELSNAY